MARRNTYRTGFTAIELLIVLAIVSLLGALAASAVFRVRATSEKTATEQTLTKLASALDVHWKAVIDAAKKDYDGLPANIKQNLVTLADNPRGSGLPTPHPRRDDRARLLYVKFRLKQEFPTSFDIALNPTNPAPKFANHLFLPGQVIPGAGAAPYTGKPSYVKAVFGKTLAPDLQSSALLLLALEQPRSGVATTSIDQSVGSNFIRTEGQFRYFVDSWGKPLQFYVFPTGTVAGASDLSSTVDPQDPEKLLAPTTVSQWRPNLVPTVPGKPWNSFDTLLHPQTSTHRLLPTVVSAGPDGDLGGAVAAVDPAMNLSAPAAFDNIYSFRLRQTGARGD